MKSYGQLFCKMEHLFTKIDNTKSHDVIRQHGERENCPVSSAVADRSVLETHICLPFSKLNFILFMRETIHMQNFESGYYVVREIIAFSIPLFTSNLHHIDIILHFFPCRALVVRSAKSVLQLKMTHWYFEALQVFCHQRACPSITNY